MTPTAHSLASAFVADHLVDWIAPHGPVMVGDVRTTARGVLVRALADLIERQREAARAQAPSQNPMDVFMAIAAASGDDPDPAHVARMREYLERVAK